MTTRPSIGAWYGVSRSRCLRRGVRQDTGEAALPVSDALKPIGHTPRTAMLTKHMIRRFVLALALLALSAGVVTQVSGAGRAAVFPSHSGH